MRTVVTDSQLLSSIQRCAARTNFYFEKDLRTQEAAFSLQRGILVHQFFSLYYGFRKESGNNKDWTDCAHYAFEKVKPFTATLTIGDLEINNVFRSLGQYCELYKHEPMEVLHVESPFALNLYESEEEDLRIIYVGVIDLIAKSLGQDEKVYDHKSQSRRSDFLLLDDQFEGYANAAKTNQLWVNVIGLQATVEPKEKFRRQPLSYPDHILERWKKHVVYWIKQWLIYKENQEWPENHQGCNKFQLCEFYGICTSASDAARAWKLQSEFITGEKWDPTKVLENRE